MTPPLANRVFVVRVESDATIVAVVDVVGPTSPHIERLPGGLDAIEHILERLIADAIPGGLPVSTAAEFVRARARLREAIAAARVRLAEGESTVVSVRFPGRMDFVTLDRETVAAALLGSVTTVTDGLGALGVDEMSRVVTLEGVAGVPGLLDALPGRIVAASDYGATDFDALLDGEGEGEGEGDGDGGRDGGDRAEIAAGPRSGSAPTTASEPVRIPESSEPEEIEDPPAEPAGSAAVSTSTALVVDRPPGTLEVIARRPERRPVQWRQVSRRVWATAAALILLTGAGAGVTAGLEGSRSATPVLSTVGQAGSGAGATQPSPTPAPNRISPPIAGLPGAGVPDAGSPDRIGPKRTPTLPAPNSGGTATGPVSGSVPPPSTGTGTASDPSPTSTPGPTSTPAPTDPPTDPPVDPTPTPGPDDPGPICDLLCPVLG